MSKSKNFRSKLLLIEINAKDQTPRIIDDNEIIDIICPFCLKTGKVVFEKAIISKKNKGYGYRCENCENEAQRARSKYFIFDGEYYHYRDHYGTRKEEIERMKKI